MKIKRIKRKLGWLMISIAFLPQAIALVLLVNTIFWRTILIMFVSQFLFVWGTEFLLGDLDRQNKELKKRLGELEK